MAETTKLADNIEVRSNGNTAEAVQFGSLMLGRPALNHNNLTNLGVLLCL